MKRILVNLMIVLAATLGLSMISATDSMAGSHYKKHRRHHDDSNHHRGHNNYRYQGHVNHRRHVHNDHCGHAAYRRHVHNDHCGHGYYDGHGVYRLHDRHGVVELNLGALIFGHH